MPKQLALPVNEFARYSKASSETRQRIIAASFGEVGTLKTSFWLGAPGPIVVFSLDKGLEGVVEEYAKKKDIYVREYDWNPTEDLSQEEAITIRDEFIADFEHAIEHARTVIWDKETQVWELFRYAEFGAPNDAPRNYPQLYQRYRRLINMPKSTDINFGLIQGMRTPWISKVKANGAQGVSKSNERERKGMDEIDELVHINIEHAIEDGEFVLKVGKSRGPGGRDIQNTTIPFVEFHQFAQLVFPDSAEADWI